MPTVEQKIDVDQVDLAQLLASLRKDYSQLSARIRTLEHSITCECKSVTLRLHFPAFRQGKPTVAELVDVIALYLVGFALPRTRIAKVDSLYRPDSMEKFKLAHLQLQHEAVSLFKRAQVATNRNGEAGELLLYLLTEWILDAPQLLAKMSLKTNRNMPVFGADGIHVRYCPTTQSLQLYWGESKIHADVNKAISEAAKSIAKALKSESVKHELKLVERHIDLSGLDESAKTAILKFLDPFEEKSNRRIDIITCLIGFDFEAFSKIKSIAGDDPEAIFRQVAITKLDEVAPRFAKCLKDESVADSLVELFFFPVPSVTEFRDLFQSRIGWKS